MGQFIEPHATPWLECTDLADLLQREESSVHTLCADLQVSPFLRGGRSGRKFLEGPQVRRALERVGFQYPRRAQCISLMMCKGGVGKTTVGYFLGRRLASYGAKVLFVDTDPQGNLTAALRPDLSGFKLSDRSPVLLDILSGKCHLREAILPLNANIHLVPSSAMNSLLERQLLAQRTDQKISPVRHLSHVLRSVETDYDYILVDCAPSLNIINASVIYASDLVLVPFQLDEFSRLGLAQTVQEVGDLQAEFKFTVTLRLLLNKYQPKEKLSLLYLGDVAAHYREILLQQTIRQSDEIKSALTFRSDFFSKKNSKPKFDFDRLAQSILKQSVIGKHLAGH